MVRTLLFRVTPLPASLVLVGIVLVSAMLTGAASLLLVPIVFALPLFATWLVASLILSLAGIEVLASFEPLNEDEVGFLR
jgi:hypothetical protein